MILAVFAGLPGTGKSALAEAAGRDLKIPVFSKDRLEASLRRSVRDRGHAPEEFPWLGYAGYDLLTALAERQLRLGQSAILDSVATFERIRAQWRALAGAHGATWRVIECVCSDEAAHRARLSVRERGIPGWYELEWSDVEAVRANYEPWDEERLVVDAVWPLDENVPKVVAYLR
jgi:predicted kinase